MSVIHISRSGKTYRLHVSKTPTGKDKFFFSTKTGGVLAEKIPDGFEVYETVDSLVFLRRKTAIVIQEDEFAMIQSSLDGIRGKSSWDFRHHSKIYPQNFSNTWGKTRSTI